MTAQLDEAFRLRQGGDLDGARRACRRALAMWPADPSAQNLQGTLDDARLDTIAAIVSFGRSLAIDPNQGTVHTNLGGVIAKNGIVGPALEALRRGLVLEPSSSPGHNNLAHAHKTAGYVVEAIASYRRCLAIDPSASGLHSNLLFTLNYLDRISSSDLFDEYRRWGMRHARSVSRPEGLRPRQGTPINVGYLSADFRDHPLGRILHSLLAAHDRSVVKVHAYVLNSVVDPLTDVCRTLCDAWREVAHLDDEAIARTIRDDGVDVLVIVGGHSADNRLTVAALRPAPVQVSFDDVSTSGVDAVDYWLTDPLLHPETGEATEMFTERLVRLPCFLVQPPILDAPPLTPPPLERRGAVTFGSFSNPAKLSPTTVAAWSAALSRTPGSRLLLKYVDWYSDTVVQQRVLELFRDRGIEAARIAFLGGDLERSAQLAAWNEVDIALDTFPFAGWTTSFEALWMGVPVVTLAGERFAGRAGLAILERLRLGDLVARTVDGFGDVAAALARDPARLARLRKELRDRLRVSPLCDATAQARALEAVYADLVIRRR